MGDRGPPLEGLPGSQNLVIANKLGGVKEAVSPLSPPNRDGKVSNNGFSLGGGGAPRCSATLEPREGVGHCSTSLIVIYNNCTQQRNTHFNHR